MSIKEFSKNDIFRNTLVTYPRFEFKIYQGKAYLNNSVESYVSYGNLNLKDQSVFGTLDFSVEEQSANLALI
jgi:hypothetical protein